MDAYTTEDRPMPAFHGAPPTDRATLACQPCRRRKAKCDRLLPHCNVCARTLQTCIYPAKRLKPGPKIGSTQRGRKRVRFGSHSSNTNHDNPDASTRDFASTQPESSTHNERSSFSEYPVIREGSTSSTTQGSYQTLPIAKSRSPDSFSPPLHGSTDGEAGDPSKDPVQITAAFLEAMSLANIMHPSHEKAEEPRQSPPWNSLGPLQDPEARLLVIEACSELGISIDQMRMLARAYFANMTAFTLFHQPTIRQKLYALKNVLHIKALLAAVCSFAARFINGYPDAQATPGEKPIIQNHARFHKLALKWGFEAVQESEDETPPIVVLQVMVLSTFYKLTEGVRGRAWRLLGECIRIAYEQRLNLIDIDRPDHCSDTEKWIADEERRRCWWAIWEMDIFASSIRRSSSAIDGTTNETYLPVKDEYWFDGHYQRSCVLEMVPIDRVTSLRESGNRSADAWFIILYSMMRNAQLLSNMATVLPDIDPENNVAQMITYFQNQFNGPKSEEAERQLPGLELAFRTYIEVLPSELSYKGEYLSFMKDVPLSSAMIGARRMDVAKYSIHLIYQLTKIMINHHYAFREVAAGKRTTDNSRHTPLNWNLAQPEEPTNAQGLQNCMDAADDILAILTRCTEQYVQYVNPFLASTVWMATALQVLRKVFAGEAVSDPGVVSKCKILRSHCEQYSQVWGTPLSLMENLDSLEERLREKQKQRYDAQMTKALIVPRESPSTKAQVRSRDEPSPIPMESVDWMAWQQQQHYLFNPDAGFNTVQGIPTEHYVQGTPISDYMQTTFSVLGDGYQHDHHGIPFPGTSATGSATAPSGHGTHAENVDPNMDFDHGFSSYLQAMMAESYTRL